MKRIGRVFALLLTVALLACHFAACGGAKGQTTLKIGGIGPLTGPAAAYGQGARNGAMLAVREINAAGGVNGMQLALDFQDDEHNVERAIHAYNYLCDEGMQILCGAVTSTPCVAVKAMALDDNLFLLTPASSAEASIKDAPNAFRVCFSDPNQGIGAAEYIKTQNLAEKVAVIYDASNVYSSGIYEKFSVRAKELGLEIVDVEAFSSESANDFNVQLTSIAYSGAELIFLPIYYQEANLILDQAEKMHMDIQFFGCDGLDGLLRQLGPDRAELAEGVMLLTPFTPDAEDEKTVRFTAAYKAAYGEVPNQFAADGYDAIYAIKLALEEAGIKSAKISREALCDKLSAAMTEITLDGVTGRTTWGEDGEPIKEPKAVVIRNGVYVAME